MNVVRVTDLGTLMDYAEFIHKAIMVLNPLSQFEEQKEEFDLLVHNVGKDEFALWIQTKDGVPMATMCATVLTNLKGERICWQWLLYAKAGADTKYAFNQFVYPWAVSQGCTIMQASIKNEAAREVWAEKFGFQKSFVVLERRIG